MAWWRFWEGPDRPHALTHENDDEPSPAERRLDAALATATERIGEAEAAQRRARIVGSRSRIGNLVADRKEPS